MKHIRCLAENGWSVHFYILLKLELHFRDQVSPSILPRKRQTFKA